MPLVGREGELRALERSLAAAAGGEGVVVVLSGEPGIGKTSLLRELGLRADSEGFRVLYVRSAPQRLPDKELLWHRIWRGLSDTQSSKCMPADHCGGFDGAELIREGVLNGGGYADSATTVRNRHSVAAFFPLILDLITKLSGDCPLLIAIDDINYADQSSLELLELLSHSIDRMPVLLALTYCPFGFTGRPEGARIIELLAARGRGLELGSLDDNATRDILRDVTGFSPDDWIVRSVRQLVGGNPRFLLECDTVVSDLARAHSRGCCSSEIRIPGTIRVAIQERLKPLSPEARKILEIGALFPKAFDPPLVSEVGDFHEAEAHAAMTELETAALIRAVTDHAYDYVHGFTKELLYRELSLSRKSYLHRRIANALELHEPGHANGNARKIAEHLIRSGEPQNVERAIRYAAFAGRQFASMRDLAKAAEMYFIAINAIESQATLDRGDLCGMLIALGEVERDLGKAEAAQQIFRRAARLAQDMRDGQKLVQIALGMPDIRSPFANSPNWVVLMLAQKALSYTPESDSSERALLMARIAAELSFLEDQLTRSEQLFTEAVEMGLRLSEQNLDVTLRIYRLRDLILRRPYVIDERITNAEKAIAVAYEAGDNDALFASSFAEFCALCEIGDIARAETRIVLMQQTATLVDRPEHSVTLLNIRAALAVYRGKLDLAKELLCEAREVANARGLGTLADYYWPSLIVPFREQGRLAELAPLAETGCEPESSWFSARALPCWLAFKMGDAVQARSQLELIAAETFANLKERAYATAGAALLGEVSAGLEMTAQAKLLYDFLLPFRSRFVIVEPAYTCFGPVSFYLGKLAVALSSHDQAVAHFEESLDADRKTGGRTWSTYSLVELAKSLCLRNCAGDRQRAAEVLTTARAEAVKLKMEVLAKEIGELASAIVPVFKAKSPDVDDLNENREAAADPGVIIKPPPLAVLRREATGWKLTTEEHAVRLRGLRGLVIMAHLLARPNQLIGTLELANLGKNGEVIADRSPLSDLGPVLDEGAKKAYRVRIEELRGELEEARSCGKEQAALKFEEELRFLTREIARAVGLLGRDRKTASEAERARVRVTNSIKFAIGKIADHSPRLASYLQRTIRTGASCCYSPEQDIDIVCDL